MNIGELMSDKDISYLSAVNMYSKRMALFNIMWVNSETTPICLSLDKSSYFYILQS
jgi:hypothetical protein